jgi:hypothetical protein
VQIACLTMRFVTVIQTDDKRSFRMHLSSRVSNCHAREVIYGSANVTMIRQAHACNPQSHLLEPLPRPRIDSIFKLTGTMRALFRLASLAVGMSVGLSSAFAEINESLNKGDIAAPAYIYDVLPRELVINFLINDDMILTVNDLRAYYTIFYNNYYNPEFGHDYSNEASHQGDKFDRTKAPESFDEVAAPEAVWSLDVRPDWFRSDLGIDADSRKAPRLGTGEFFDPWTNNNMAGDSDILLISPPQYQVATCNGFAERPDLEYCKSPNNYPDPHHDDSGEQRHRRNNDRDLASNNSSAISSNDASEGNQQTQSEQIQSDIVKGFPQLMLTNVNDLALGTGSAVAELCDSVSSCTIIGTWYFDYLGIFGGGIYGLSSSIDSPIGTVTIAPIDTTTSTIPIDSTTQADFPPPVIFVDDPLPGSGLGSIVTPPTVSSTVPETPTWIMTIIGFCIIVFAGKRRTIYPTTVAVVAAIVKIAKKYARQDTA